MMTKQTAKTKRILIIALAAFVMAGMSVVLFTNNSYAATKKKPVDKALKAGVSFTGINYEKLYDGSLKPEQQMEELTANMYSFGVTFKGKVGLNSDMKVSGTVHVPVKLLNKNGSHIDIVPIVACKKFWVEGRYVAMFTNTDGKVNVRMFNKMNKPAKVGKRVKITEDRKYYTFRLNNFPMDKVTNENVAVPSGKQNADLVFSVSGFGKHGCGFIYLDDMKLKAAKTVETDFAKKNYKQAYGFRTMAARQLVPVEIAECPVH